MVHRNSKRTSAIRRQTPFLAATRCTFTVLEGMTSGGKKSLYQALHASGLRLSSKYSNDDFLDAVSGGSAYSARGPLVLLVVNKANRICPIRKGDLPAGGIGQRVWRLKQLGYSQVEFRGIGGDPEKLVVKRVEPPFNEVMPCTPPPGKDPLRQLERAGLDFDAQEQVRSWKFKARHPEAIDFARIAEDLSPANPVAFLHSGREEGNAVVLHPSLVNKADLVEGIPTLTELVLETMKDRHIKYVEPVVSGVIVFLDNRAQFSVIKQWASSVRSAPWPTEWDGAREFTVTLEKI